MIARLRRGDHRRRRSHHFARAGAKKSHLPVTAMAGESMRQSAHVRNGEDRTRTPVKNTGKTGGDGKSGAKSGALSSDCAALGDDDKANIDPRLAMLVERWSALADSTKEAIVAMVDAARTPE